MSGPLAGVRVIDMTMNVMGPYASQTLGDMGADICKIEPPEGDPLRRVGPARNPGMGPYFLQLNRNKRSLALDLKHPGGRAALHRMAAQADVLLYSLRPQAMARLGAGYAELAARNPRLIYCGTFGFGQRGPYADRPAYDDLIQALTAIPALQARATGGPPSYVANAMTDRIVGLMAASAIGMALYARERTGKGQAIEVPMFESMAQFIMGDHMYGLTFEPPLGPAGYARTMDPNRKPYRTADGYIGVLIYTDRHWQRFLTRIGRADMAADPRFTTLAGRTQHIGLLYAFLADLFPTRSTAEWVALLTEEDIPAAAMHTPESLLDDPHMQAIGFFRVVAHPSEGPIRVMDIPQTWSATSPSIVREAPRLGEHTRELLEEYGFSAAEIAMLMESRAAIAAEGAEGGT
jgi:crotonobetainyl-CoA:carnitine CoA-transferase CaiB-like acyl-CoA transferase